MVVKIDFSVVNGTLTERTHRAVLDKIQQLHRAHRRLKVFDVKLDLKNPEAPVLSIQVWTTREVDEDMAPDFRCRLTGTSAISVVNDGLEEIENQATARPKERKDEDAIAVDIPPWVKSPYLWGGVATLLLLLVLVSIYRSGGRGTVPVNGIVTYNSEPVTDARVVFHAIDGPPATAMTDEQGRFSLSTYVDNDGAYPGPYVVTVFVRPINDKPRADPDENLEQFLVEEVELRDAPPAAQPQELQYPIPTAYLNAAETPLKVTVPHSGVVELTLSDDYASTQ